MSRQRAPGQLGFDALLAQAETANSVRQIERECVHLPGTMDEAVPFYRALIERHHAAMLAGDAPAAMALRDEADRLATKLNKYEPGILASDDAPGCVLARLTTAENGTLPLWGQCGSFEITHGTMRVRIEMEGIFSVASNVFPWLGFSAHAVELDRPFLSETGFRSFIALRGELQPGITPDEFVRQVIAEHVARELKGKLRPIKPEYRARREAA